MTGNAGGERVGSSAEVRAVAAVPDLIWSPLATGGLILAIGLLGMASGQPWLFPSLAPTAYLQGQSPKLPAARFYNTLVGHLVGLGAGLLVVALLGADKAPGVIASRELTTIRLGAAALAMTLTMLGTLLVRAPHPPAAATTLLIAEGSYKLQGRDALLIVIGVLLVASLGEGLRQVRLRYLPPPSDQR